MLSGASVKVIQLLQHFEQLSSVFAQAVSVWSTEYGVRGIIGEIIRSVLKQKCFSNNYFLPQMCFCGCKVACLIPPSHSFREIGQRSSEELARDSAGVRAFASFIAELGTFVPELMMPNISVLITHLEGEVLHTLECSSCQHNITNAPL